MKTLKAIIKQKPVFLHLFTSQEDVANEFKQNTDYNSPPTDLTKIKILFASYGCDNYSGDAFVLFETNGFLYEVNGGHCSCMGLEGLWEPELVVLKELETRLKSGKFGTDNYSDNEFAKELKKFLGVTD